MSNEPQGSWNHLALTNKEETLTARIDLEGHQKSLASLVGRSITGQQIEYLHRGSLPDRLRDADEGYDWKKIPRDFQGWNLSEIIMFPIVGPCQNNLVLVGSNTYPMGQHGIARHLTFEPVDSSSDTAAFRSIYEANTPIPNPKAEQPGQPQSFTWPYTIELGRSYQVQGNMLITTLSVKNLSREPMPYEIGWHPAFDILGGVATGQVRVGEENITLEGVREASKTAAVKRETNNLSYTNIGGRIEVTSNMPKAMVWSPSDGELICLEPVTQWGNKAFEGFPTLEGALQPGEERTYTVTISPSPK